MAASHHTCNRLGAAGLVVGLDVGAADAWAIFGDAEFGGKAGEEFFDDELLFDAYHGIHGAGHADVGNVGGASGQDAFICGLDVGVGADDGGTVAV